MIGSNEGDCKGNLWPLEDFYVQEKLILSLTDLLRAIEISTPNPNQSAVALLTTLAHNSGKAASALIGNGVGEMCVRQPELRQLLAELSRHDANLFITVCLDKPTIGRLLEELRSGNNLNGALKFLYAMLSNDFDKALLCKRGIPLALAEVFQGQVIACRVLGLVLADPAMSRDVPDSIFLSMGSWPTESTFQVLAVFARHIKRARYCISNYDDNLTVVAIAFGSEGVMVLHLDFVYSILLALDDSNSLTPIMKNFENFNSHHPNVQ